MNSTVCTPELAQSIRSLAARLGYVACGFTRAEPLNAFSKALDDRVQRFPDAAPLYEQMRHRADPTRTAPWAKSMVVCIRYYGTYRVPESLDGHIGRNYLFDRRCAECPEHDMARSMTAGMRELGLKVKKGGVPDRLAAVKAGVARLGRNGFAFLGDYGSWINIATWRVDAELPPNEPSTDCPCPPNCRACIDACPTHAIAAPYCVRIDRCVAYLTYHAQHPIAPDLWKRMGSWIYGCDECQLVCPLNREAWQGRKRADWLEKRLPYLTPEALSRMDASTYRTFVHPLFWYIPLNAPERWRANAQRALNAGRTSRRDPEPSRRTALPDALKESRD